jgi:hypothetical protein
MFRSSRRKSGPPSGSLQREPALQAFEALAGMVERAKQALLAAVPRGRGPGAPLAEAVAAFEGCLRDAQACLDAWPADVHGAERRAVAGAVEQSLRRAEDLRLRASPHGYEELYALLGETLDPLDAVSEVGHRLVR